MRTKPRRVRANSLFISNPEESCTLKKNGNFPQMGRNLSGRGCNCKAMVPQL